MWFNNKNVQLNITGKSFDLTWGELGAFLVELAMQNTMSDFDYIKTNFSSMAHEIEKKPSQMVVLSLAFNLAIMNRSIISNRKIDGFYFYSDIKEGINKGFSDIDINNQRILSQDHIDHIYKVAEFYKKPCLISGLNIDGSANSEQPIAYAHSKNIISLYGVGNDNDLVDVFNLTKYFSNLFSTFLSVYGENNILVCKKCDKAFKSPHAARNPFAKHCKVCDNEI